MTSRPKYNQYLTSNRRQVPAGFTLRSSLVYIYLYFPIVLFKATGLPFVMRNRIRNPQVRMVEKWGKAWLSWLLCEVSLISFMIVSHTVRYTLACVSTLTGDCRTKPFGYTYTFAKIFIVGWFYVEKKSHIPFKIMANIKCCLFPGTPLYHFIALSVSHVLFKCLRSIPI